MLQRAGRPAEIKPPQGVGDVVHIDRFKRHQPFKILRRAMPVLVQIGQRHGMLPALGPEGSRLFFGTQVGGDNLAAAGGHDGGQGLQTDPKAQTTLARGQHATFPQHLQDIDKFPLLAVVPGDTVKGFAPIGVTREQEMVAGAAFGAERDRAKILDHPGIGMGITIEQLRRIGGVKIDRDEAGRWGLWFRFRLWRGGSTAAISCGTSDAGEVRAFRRRQRDMGCSCCCAVKPEGRPCLAV